MWEILALYSKIWLEFGIMWLIHEDWELVNGVIKKFYNNMIKEFEFPTSWLLTWFSDANCRTIAKRVILYTSNHFEKKIAPLSSWLAALPSTTMQGGWTSRSGGGDHQIQGGGYDHPDGTGFGWPTTPRRWAPGVVAPPWGYHPWERLGKILFEMTWQGSFTCYTTILFSKFKTMLVHICPDRSHLGFTYWTDRNFTRSKFQCRRYSPSTLPPPTHQKQEKNNKT